MIIGIDETGTFDLNSSKHSWFIGAHLHEKKDETTATDKLNAWKEKNKHLKNGWKNEIKGNNLDEKTMLSFVTNVINYIPSLYITAVCTKPNMHKKKDVQFHRDYHIKSINQGIKECKEAGNDSLAEQYELLKNWYRNLNYQQLLKIWILGQAIGYNYREHIIQTILDGTDKTLGTIDIKIDKDFINDNQPTTYWKDLLRSWFYSYTYRNPIPIIKEWPQNHPFYMTKIDNELPEEYQSLFIDKDHIFKNNCNFVLSHQSSIVQIADIVASLISEYYENNTFAESYSIIKEKLIPIRENPIHLLQMAPSQSNIICNAPNPYKLIHNIKK